MKGLTQIVNNNIYVVPGASLAYIAPSNLFGRQRHNVAVSYPKICPSVPLRQAWKDGEVECSGKAPALYYEPTYTADGHRGLPIILAGKTG